MSIIEPIDSYQRQQVIVATHQCLVSAAEIMQREFTIIPIEFDLTGRAAGMYCVRNNRRWIRYNPYLFAKYFDDNINETVPHEVAHYVTDMVYGHARVKPHGQQWRELMLSLGVNPRRTCEYNLEGIPQRRQHYHTYVCQCTSHQLSRRRHNKIIRERVLYFCRHCRQPLQAISQNPA
jgi:SprT protein